jgi:hypothetical protein
MTTESREQRLILRVILRSANVRGQNYCVPEAVHRARSDTETLFVSGGDVSRVTATDSRER